MRYTLTGRPGDTVPNSTNLKEERRRNLRRNLVDFLLVLLFATMIADWLWVCNTLPSGHRPDLGRIYPIICHKGGPPTWLNESEHIQLTLVETAGLASFFAFLFRTIRRHPKVRS